MKKTKFNGRTAIERQNAKVLKAMDELIEMATKHGRIDAIPRIRAEAAKKIKHIPAKNPLKMRL